MNGDKAKAWLDRVERFIYSPKDVEKLIDVARASVELREDIYRIIDLDIDWRPKHPKESSAVSMIVDTRNLHAFNEALLRLVDGGET